MTRLETIDRNAAIREANAMEFSRIFKLPLSQFWRNNVEGFDIVKFDERVVKSGKRILAVVVRERWGDDAVKLIYRLLGLHDGTGFTGDG